MFLKLVRNFLCPVCGGALKRKPYALIPDKAQLVPVGPPYDVHWGQPSHETCDCCGYKFGEHDKNGISFRDHVVRWVHGGCKWFRPELKPVIWSYTNQLRTAEIAIPPAIRDLTHSYPCPVCGFALEKRPYESIPDNPHPIKVEPPYCVHWGMPTYNVCICCGYEFGFDDEPGTGEGTSFRDYLVEWVRDGMKWFYPHEKPADWSLLSTLESAGIEVPAEIREGLTPPKKS